MTNPPAEDVLSKVEGKDADVANGDVTVDDDFQREMFLWVNRAWDAWEKAIQLFSEWKVLWFGLQQMLLSPSCHIKSPASGVSDPVLWEVSTDDVIWTTRCFIFNMNSYHFCLLTFSYRQAQATVLAALPLLNKHSIATKRPDDYFAEMAKTDQHMQKVSFLFLLLLLIFFYPFTFPITF